MESEYSHALCSLTHLVLGDRLTAPNTIRLCEQELYRLEMKPAVFFALSVQFTLALIMERHFLKQSSCRSIVVLVFCSPAISHASVIVVHSQTVSSVAETLTSQPLCRQA